MSSEVKTRSWFLGSDDAPCFGVVLVYGDKSWALHVFLGRLMLSVGEIAIKGLSGWGVSVNNHAMWL